MSLTLLKHMLSGEVMIGKGSRQKPSSHGPSQMNACILKKYNLRQSRQIPEQGLLPPLHTPGGEGGGESPSCSCQIRSSYR